MFSYYPLRKTNPRNRISESVRFQQKLFFNVTTRQWHIYTWLMGANDIQGNPKEDMYWHPINREEALHFYKVLEIPIVRTQESTDWTKLDIPFVCTGSISALEYSLTGEPIAAMRHKLSKQVEDIETFRAQLIREGYSPHLSVEDLDAEYQLRYGYSLLQNKG